MGMHEKKAFGFRVETAIRFISEQLPQEDFAAKPVLFHSIRIGTRLYNDGYGETIVLAGFLHDVLENTAVTSDEMSEKFGAEITAFVEANSKDSSITDGPTRRAELIQRCFSTSQSAAIVKAADILDNFTYYTAIQDTEQISFCRQNARTAKECMPPEYDDPIFTALITLLS